MGDSNLAQPAIGSMVRDDPSRGIDPDSAVAEGTARLSLDAVLELLSNSRRRFAVYTLMDLPAGLVDFEDLVDSVVALESTAGTDGDGDGSRRRVFSDLHHWHVPVLQETGVVSYDQRSAIVQYEGDARLERWARRLREAEFPGHD